MNEVDNLPQCVAQCSKISKNISFEFSTNFQMLDFFMNFMFKNARIVLKKYSFLGLFFMHNAKAFFSIADKASSVVSKNHKNN